MSFFNWQGSEQDYLKILKSLENLNLFSLTLEMERGVLSLFQKYGKSLTFRAYRKTLLISFSDFKDFFHLTSFFNDTEVDIPFNSKEEEIKDFLDFASDKDFSISFLLTRDNIKIFERLIVYSEKNNKKIKIPNPNLIRYKNELSQIYLRKEDLKNLEYIKPLISKAQIEIHDYFLAKFFGLSDADRFGGCQAGKLLGHVENGILYPCSSIPEQVGSLLEYDFEFLWNRAYNIVNDIFKKCCNDCNKRVECKLGCIGNAIFLGDNKDPLCEE
ncbi:MAG: hypothetical protein N2999_03150 [Proteobacteria bacterium]|nr:hypothetical protein [Pseudomonadota bacterium]